MNLQGAERYVCPSIGSECTTRITIIRFNNSRPQAVSQVRLVWQLCQHAGGLKPRDDVVVKGGGAHVHELGQQADCVNLQARFSVNISAVQDAAS